MIYILVLHYTVIFLGCAARTSERMNHNTAKDALSWFKKVLN